MRIYPYGTLNGDVTLKLREIRLDGNPVIPDFIDAERQVVGVSAIGASRWETLSFDVRIDGPVSELSIENGPWENVSAIVAINCKHSNTRTTVPLSSVEGSPSRWLGSATLDRSEWFGSITVMATIYATVDQVPNRLIGYAEPWQVRLDDLPRPPIGQAMTIVWERFGSPSEGREFLGSYAAEPYFLRIDPNDPILFLNRDFDGLEGLLGDRRRRPAAERALHDQARGAIATHAWTLLFLDAMAHVEEEGGDVAWPVEDWRKNVLTSMLGSMYGGSDDETLRRAWEEWRDPDSAANVLERAHPAAAAQARLARLMRSAIRALPNTDSLSDTEDEELVP